MELEISLKLLFVYTLFYHETILKCLNIKSNNRYFEIFEISKFARLPQ